MLWNIFSQFIKKVVLSPNPPLSLILSREIERERGVQLESILLISALIIALKLNLDIRDNDSREDKRLIWSEFRSRKKPQEEFSDNFNIFLKHISAVVIFEYDNI